MCEPHTDTLWRGFPKTLPEFEERFSSETDCRDYLAECRWNGQPVCDRCDGRKLWSIHNGGHFECGDCGHQMSLTSGTLFHGTRKPLRVWFRAIWEVCVHKTGLSAADLQRILGFGSYETAWVWLHKIRRATVRENRDKLEGCIQIDETFVSAGGDEKQIVIVAVEEFGRLRLTHAPGNHTACIKHIADSEIASNAVAKTDGHGAYNETSLGDRAHLPKIQTKLERQENDYLQLLHWNASNLKNWLSGTHYGGQQPKHLQSYLDEFCFRYNRRKTKGIGRLVARCLQGMLARKPMTMRQLIDNTYECRNFQTASY